MRYRRSDIAGGTYFFTVNLCDRRQHLLVEQADRLRSSIARVKARHPFTIDAMLVLPDHLHAIWTLPQNDCDYAMRWMLIKAAFSRGVDKNESISVSRQIKRERGIWQRRYWEHLIRDENDYARHVDYIHFNPVKHGYVKRALDWPFSSIHTFIGHGVLNRDWGGEPDNDGIYGER
ncbi:transposase [uncultured Amphritea sp.]|uniref:REP-associated tyrosine transposase n=1 Tax=uncultured Amphritea sp. TaxID=981605 RepID=UPI0026166516|nr:transposase [uncultured Amphritea sp.]